MERQRKEELDLTGVWGQRISYLIAFDLLIKLRTIVLL